MIMKRTPVLSQASSIDSVVSDDAPLLRPKPTTSGLTLFTCLLCGVSTIGGFLFGYDTGVVSGALVKLQKEFDLSDGQQEWVVGIAVAAAALGAALGGFISTNLGRKPTLMVSSLLFSAGSVLLFTANSYLALVAGRAVLGLGVGLASMSVPAYIAESSPAHLRGRLVTAFGATICIGQFVASVVAGVFSSVDQGWRWMLGIALVPSVAMGLGMIFLPESPRYLVQRGKDEEVERILQKISGSQDVQDELNEIRRALTAETEYSSHGFLHMIRAILGSVPVRRAMFIGCALQAFQQLAGINTVMYYSTTMIKMAGVRDDSTAIWLSCIPSFCNALFACVSMAIVERFPRRKLLLSTLIGTIIGLICLGGAYFAIANTTAAVSHNSCPSISHISYCNDCVLRDCTFCSTGKPAAREVGECIAGPSNCSSTYTIQEREVCYSPYSWTVIAAMVLYIAMFATGIGTLAWTINSELYPMWARGYALSLSTMTNWMFNLVIAFTFLDLTRLLTKYGAFWLYTGLSVGGWLIFYFKLPETRGVPLERVERLFS